MMNTYNTPKAPVFTIKNFKHFRTKTKIVIKPISILVGPNGSGKSSIIQALNIFNNSILATFNKNNAVAQENFNSLEFDEIVTNDSNTNTIQLQFDYSQTVWEGTMNSYVYENFHDAKVTLQLREKLNRVIVDYIEVLNSEFKLRIYPNNKKAQTLSIDLANKINKKEISEDWSEILKSGGFKDLRSAFLDYDDTYVKCEFNWEGSQVENDNNYILESILGVLFRYNPLFITGSKDAPISIYDKAPVWLMYDINKNFFNEVTVKNYQNKLEEANTIWNKFKYHLAFLTSEYLPDVNIDETRKEPPEFFNLINDEFENDFYGLAKFMKMVSDAGPDTYEWDDKDDFINILNEFEIADDIKLVKASKIKPNHQLFRIKLRRNKNEFDLKNLSSGGKQLLPIILSMLESRVGLDNNIAIRQPELHLHPKLQMKLADLALFIQQEHTKRYCYLIIETHSEHIIRKFQYLIAKGDLRKETISIFYVDPIVETNNSKIIEIPFDDRGMFTIPWPSGFFEERAVLNIQLIEELLKRNN